MSREYDNFVQFVNHAEWDDGGEKSCLDAFGFSLNEVVKAFLGEGDWKPNFNTVIAKPNAHSHFKSNLFYMAQVHVISTSLA